MKAIIDDSYREIGRLEAEVKLAEERHRLEQGAIDILRSEKERLEAEAVAQVELTTDLYVRITARDERIAELEAALPRESWFSATLAHYNGCDDSYPITMPMTKGDVRRIRDALKGDADGRE